MLQRKGKKRGRDGGKNKQMHRETRRERILKETEEQGWASERRARRQQLRNEAAVKMSSAHINGVSLWTGLLRAPGATLFWPVMKGLSMSHTWAVSSAGSRRKTQTQRNTSCEERGSPGHGESNQTCSCDTCERKRERSLFLNPLCIQLSGHRSCERSCWFARCHPAGQPETESVFYFDFSWNCFLD